MNRPDYMKQIENRIAAAPSGHAFITSDFLDIADTLTVNKLWLASPDWKKKSIVCNEIPHRIRIENGYCGGFEILKKLQKVRIHMISKIQFGPPWPGAWPRAISDSFISLQKVRKAPNFLSKSGVFMVAEAGLEPTTSGLWGVENPVFPNFLYSYFALFPLFSRLLSTNFK